jgi:tRNA dimethylallyltransferase
VAPTKKNLAVVGPTGVGKSNLAIKLAKKGDFEVINTDSRLFYRGFDIGTSKPSKKDLSQIKHHLVNFLSPEANFSLSEFVIKVNDLIQIVRNSSRIPLLVGGSGQYTKAVLENWDVPQVPPNYTLRAELDEIVKKKSVGDLYSKLLKEFPENAEGIDKKNSRRIIRAYELGKSNTLRVSKKFDEQSTQFMIIGLTMDRDLLYDRIDSRINSMLKNGWVQEVRYLIDSGVGLKDNAFFSIGYPEIYSYIKNECNLEEAVAQIKKKTRNLIRHQYNWFKLSDPRIKWFDVGLINLIEIAERIEKEIHEY